MEFRASEPSEPIENAVEVATPHDSLTMTIEVMDEEWLTGSTSYLEEAKIRSQALKEIQLGGKEE